MSQKVLEMGFNETKIQTKEIGEMLWFRASHVYRVFGRKFHTNLLNTIPENQKQKVKISLSHNNSLRLVWFISESAVYTIAFRSDTDEAVKFTQSVAEFRAKLRRGEITQEDLDKAQSETQLFLFRLTEPDPQRKKNHAFNKMRNKPEKNSQIWRDRYEDLLGVSFEEKRQALLEMGCPEWVLKHSVQDGLRWFENTYAHAMAMSDMSRLVKDLGLSEVEAREIVKDSKRSYDRLGEIFGRKFALGKNYSPRKRTEDNPDQPDLFNW